MSAPADRVARVLALGRRIADPTDALGEEARRALLVTSGLSREGLELALTKHLETSVDPADLASLLVWAGEAPRCWIVLSANVCTAPLRALCLGLAASPVLRLRPSRRDPALTTILARELAAQGLDVALAAALDPQSGDHLHAYGADATLRALAADLPRGVLLRGHGTGLGVALIGAGADLDEAAHALAADVIPFDQRGCLSPRVALIEGDAARATTLADVLHRVLLDHGTRVPRGPLDGETVSALALYRAATDALGATFTGPHHLLGLDLAPRALLLPPAARALHLAPCVPSTIAALLAPWAEYLTTVGAIGDAACLAPLRALAPGARFAPLGRMQRPPLDGPVDRRAHHTSG
ncbi:MAG: acyl-CoA reductase [Minicystis sp.]